MLAALTALHTNVELLMDLRRVKSATCSHLLCGRCERDLQQESAPKVLQIYQGGFPHLADLFPPAVLGELVMPLLVMCATSSGAVVTLHHWPNHGQKSIVRLSTLTVFVEKYDGA